MQQHIHLVVVSVDWHGGNCSLGKSSALSINLTLLAMF